MARELDTYTLRKVARRWQRASEEQKRLAETSDNAHWHEGNAHAFEWAAVTLLADAKGVERRAK